MKEDTDGDGLSDCEEIEKYFTNPLKIPKWRKSKWSQKRKKKWDKILMFALVIGYVSCVIIIINSICDIVINKTHFKDYNDFLKHNGLTETMFPEEIPEEAENLKYYGENLVFRATSCMSFTLTPEVYEDYVKQLVEKDIEKGNPYAEETLGTKATKMKGLKKNGDFCKKVIDNELSDYKIIIYDEVDESTFTGVIGEEESGRIVIFARVR